MVDNIAIQNNVNNSQGNVWTVMNNSITNYNTDNKSSGKYQAVMVDDIAIHNKSSHSSGQPKTHEHIYVWKPDISINIFI